MCVFCERRDQWSKEQIEERRGVNVPNGIYVIDESSPFDEKEWEAAHQFVGQHEWPVFQVFDLGRVDVLYGFDVAKPEFSVFDDPDVTLVDEDEPIEPLARELPQLVNINHFGGGGAHARGRETPK